MLQFAFASKAFEGRVNGLAKGKENKSPEFIIRGFCYMSFSSGLVLNLLHV